MKLSEEPWGCTKVLKNVFIIKEVDLRVLPGGKPPDEEYGSDDRMGFLYDVDAVNIASEEPHQVVNSRGSTPLNDFAIEVEGVAYELDKAHEKLRGNVDFETFMRIVEHIRESISSLRFEADRMLRLREDR